MMLNIERLEMFYPDGEYLYAVMIAWPCSCVTLQISVLLSLLYFKGILPHSNPASARTQRIQSIENMWATEVCTLYYLAMSGS